jgi:hypothetical protein
LFPRFFTRPPGALDSQPPPRSDHVEACRPRGYVSANCSRGAKAIPSARRQPRLTRAYARRVAALYTCMSISRRKGHPALPLLALFAIVALLVGCWAGAQASAQTADRHRDLTASQEQRLLALIARARTDATAHRPGAVFSTLSEFTSYVQSLRRSGSIDRSIASVLMLKARITESRVAAQLKVSPRSTAAAADTTGTVSSTTPAQAGTQSPPSVPVNQTASPPANQPSTPPGDQATAPQGIVGAIVSWWEAAKAYPHAGPGWHQGYGHPGHDQSDPSQQNLSQQDPGQQDPGEQDPGREDPGQQVPGRQGSGQGSYGQSRHGSQFDWGGGDP